MYADTSRFYSAAVIFEKRDGVWGVYGVTVPGRAETKFPGGSSKSFETDPIETFDREMTEELKIEVPECVCCHDEPHKPNHHKYFYLVRRYVGRLNEGEFFDDDVLKVLAWTSLSTFAVRSYHHRQAFYHALLQQCEDSDEFKRDNRKFIKDFARGIR